MIIQKNVDLDFSNGNNTPTVSKTYRNFQADVLALNISGTMTSGTFFVEGRNVPGGEWTSLAGIDLNALALVSGGFTKSGIYEIGIASVRELRFRPEGMSGQVKVSAQLISTEEN